MRSRKRARLLHRLGWLLILLAACRPALPSPSPSPTLIATALPTPTPHPTPTPLPPVPIAIRWPARVSALEDIVLRVDLPGLAERDPKARVWAQVSDPLYRLWWMSNLEPAEGGTYLAVKPLHLPLKPPPGEWRLRVSLLTTAPVSGERTLRFTPEPVPLRDLSTEVRPGIEIQIPRAFAATWAGGDDVSGGRVWTGAGGEVGLWWIPGPAEPLSEDTARMLVEVTLGEGAEVLAAEPVEWAGLPGFRFQERWPQGPGEALVVQGKDHWLVLLRVRALNGEQIPPLLEEIRAGFRVGQ